MFQWLKQWLFDWAGRDQLREIQRLHAELVRLKAEVLKNNGGQSIRLSPEAHQRLNKLRKKLDPEVLKRIDLLADAKYRLSVDRSWQSRWFSESFQFF